jgi:hypothetical protein
VIHFWWCSKYPREKYSALAFKYVLLDYELHRRTTKDLLLKCLDSDQARVAWEKFMKASMEHINRLLR